MMNNSHDEIKKLLKASRTMLSSKNNITETYEIRKKYGLITEQEVEFDSGDITKKIDVGNAIEDTIERDEERENKREKTQGYRISGGILYLHGENEKELILTSDEKKAFQETMEEFVTEVSNYVDFGPLNVYKNEVTWEGEVNEYALNFRYSTGEKEGVYVQGDMIKVDKSFLEFAQKLNAYYEKFKSKWVSILGTRKETKINQDFENED
jgi:hypothetical protein